MYTLLCNIQCGGGGGGNRCPNVPNKVGGEN